MNKKIIFTAQIFTIAYLASTTLALAQTTSNLCSGDALNQLFCSQNLPDMLNSLFQLSIAVGGILAMQGRGMPLSVSAAVGFITLSGVSVLSSMVLISFIRQSMAAGMSLGEAIQHSCVACLRTGIPPWSCFSACRSRSKSAADRSRQ